VEFIAANTDFQVLEQNLAPVKIQLGVNCTRGLGAGGNPEVGAKATQEDIEKVREIIQHQVDEYILLKTNRTTLRVTPDHPFYVGHGTFKTIEALRAGDVVFAWDGQSLSEQKIDSLLRVRERVPVYNQTDHPNTFRRQNSGSQQRRRVFHGEHGSPRGKVAIETLHQGTSFSSDQATSHGRRSKPLLARSGAADRNEIAASSLPRKTTYRSWMGASCRERASSRGDTAIEDGRLSASMIRGCCQRQENRLQLAVTNPILPG
jgi:hypothetical protein